MKRCVGVLAAVVATLTGCSFNGLNSLPLPGAVATGPTARTYHVEIANVGTLEPNSPVLIDNVVVGSVRRMRVDGWHADVEVAVEPTVRVPGNAVATVGQTSLLGSMHLALFLPHRFMDSPGYRHYRSRIVSFPETENKYSRKKERRGDHPRLRHYRLRHALL